MGKHPMDKDRSRDAKVAREYARVEREQGEPTSDPKVKAMTKAANHEDSAQQAREYARVEREQGEPTSDPKVRAMTKAAHKDEDKSLVSRVKKFLRIDRQKPES